MAGESGGPVHQGVVHVGDAQAGRFLVTPRDPSMTTLSLRKRLGLEFELGTYLAPQSRQSFVIEGRVRSHLSRLEGAAESWWEGRTKLDTALAGSRPLSRGRGSLLDGSYPAVLEHFCVGGQSLDYLAVLRPRIFNRVPEGPLSDFDIRRTGRTEYVFTFSQFSPRHSTIKLRRWAIAVLLASPHLDVGAHLNAASTLAL